MLVIYDGGWKVSDATNLVIGRLKSLQKTSPNGDSLLDGARHYDGARLPRMERLPRSNRKGKSFLRKCGELHSKPFCANARNGRDWEWGEKGKRELRI